MGSYRPGDIVRISATFTVAGVPTDPTTVVARLKRARELEELPTVVPDGAGVFHADITATLEGVYRYRFEGDTPAAGAEEGEFSVRSIYAD